jgi:hypothetical protein
MAIKTIRVFAEYTSDGYVPMPSQGNIDYGITLGSTFPETQPSSFQTDDPNIDVAVTTMTDYYVWIRTHGTSWNPFYTRVVRIYPDSPSINSVVMNMIVAVGSGGTSIGGGSGVSYYLNGGTSQGVLDGSTYYEMNKVPVEGTGVDFFKINTTGFQNIAQFVTDAGDPGLLNIPGGNWPLGFYFSASNNTGNPSFYAEIYKYSAAGVFTLLGSGVANPEVITNGQAIDFYTSNVAIPDTTLLVTDRIAVRIFVNTDGNRTINLHTQDSHLSTVGTTFTRGITAINGLIKQVQYFAIGNAGSDVSIVSDNDTHTINLPTASATKRGLLSGTDWATFNAKQPALSGDGFVKISGSTISYDNNTYLTPLDAASVYQRLDKMVSNLLPSNTEYPNSNAVLDKLALKANIENPSFTGSMNIVGIESRINFYDENNAIKYFIGYDSGFLRIFQNAGSASRFYINSDGKTFIPGILEVGSVIKSGGTASQFLKADGSVDGTTYATSSSLSSYLLASVAATTYQRIDKMVSNLLASDTEYPNSNAVLAKLALKADAANPNFTGSMNITGIESRINFYDENNARKYFIGYDGGTLRIYQDTGSASRYYINPSGKTFIPGDLEVGTVSKSGGTASQFLKADGSVDSSTYVTSASLSSYLLSSTAASTYQRLDKMVSNLLASDTEYPNSNAVLAALALKANAANPTFTGDFTISGATPRLYFVDTDNNPDYTVFTDSGYFYIYNQTAGSTKFSINPDGNTINAGTLTSTSFIKSGGTSSQVLMADGSVSSFPNVSLYLPLAGGTMTGSIVNNVDGGVIIESNATENNNWLWKENNKLWGHFWFNKGSQAGQTIGTYTTIGAESFYMGGNSNVGIAMPSGWTGYTSGSYIAAMISNYTGYIYSASTVYAATSMLVGGNTVLHAGNYSSYALPLSGGTLSGSPVFASAYGNGTGDWTNMTTPTYLVNPSSGYWRINHLSNSPSVSGVYNFQTGKSIYWGEDTDTGIYNFRGRTVTISSNAIRPLLLEGSSNQYIYIKSSSGYEAMSQYYNPVAGDWYAGIRVTAGLGTLSSYHIYSGVYGNDVFILNTNGTAKFASVVTLNNVLDFNGDNGIASLSDKLALGVLGTSYAWIQSFGSRPLVINASGNNVLINTTTNAGYTLYVNGTGRFEGKLSATKSAKNAYAFEIKGSLYGAPRFQLYDLAADANAFVGMGVDMSGGSYEFSNYFPRYGSNGRWSVGSWAGDFGTGQYVSGYNEKLYITESLSEFSTVLKVNNFFRNAGNTNLVYWASGSQSAYFGNVLGDVSGGTANRTTYFRGSGNGASVWWGRVDGNGNNVPNAALDSNDGQLGFWVNSGSTGGGNWTKIFRMETVGITMESGSLIGNVSGTLNGYNTSIAYGTRNVRGKILVADPDSGNISTQNPETYSGEVRLGAAWARGGIYASGVLSMSTSSNQMDFVFGDVVKASLSASTGLILGSFVGGNYNENLRLVDSSGNYSVIAFGATGTSGAGRFNFLKNPQDNLEIRNGSSTNIFLITQAGVTTFLSYVNASAFYETSDIRLKDLLIDDVQISNIENLKAKLYIKNGRQEYGYFAQEVQSYMPSAVTIGENGYLNLSYREVHTVKIARLEREVEYLKKQLNVA